MVKRRRRGLLLFQLGAVVVFLAVVWFIFGQTVLAPGGQSTVPERLGVLELAELVEGDEAVAQVGQLHGIDVGLTGAYIARYASGGQRSTVWVGETENDPAAVELTDRMVQAIGRGNSPFSNIQRLSIAGHEVYQVDGPGGVHFLYYSGTKVVWLSIEAGDPVSIVEEAVEVF